MHSIQLFAKYKTVNVYDSCIFVIAKVTLVFCFCFFHDHYINFCAAGTIISDRRRPRRESVREFSAPSPICRNDRKAATVDRIFQGGKGRRLEFMGWRESGCSQVDFFFFFSISETIINQ